MSFEDEASVDRAFAQLAVSGIAADSDGNVIVSQRVFEQVESLFDSLRSELEAKESKSRDASAIVGDDPTKVDQTRNVQASDRTAGGIEADILKATEEGKRQLDEALHSALSKLDEHMRTSAELAPSSMLETDWPKPSLQELTQTIESLRTLAKNDRGNPHQFWDSADQALQVLNSRLRELHSSSAPKPNPITTVDQSAIKNMIDAALADYATQSSAALDELIQQKVESALAKEEERHDQALSELRAELNDQYSQRVQDIEVDIFQLKRANERIKYECHEALANQEKRHEPTLSELRQEMFLLENALLELKTGSKDGVDLTAGAKVTDQSRLPAGPDPAATLSLPRYIPPHRVGTISHIPSIAISHISADGEASGPSDLEFNFDSVTIESSDCDDTESTISAMSDQGFYVMEPSKVEATSTTSTKSTKPTTATANNTSSSFSTADPSTFDNTGPLAVSPAHLNRLLRAALLLNAQDGQALIAQLDRSNADRTRDFIPFEMFLREYYKSVPGGKRKGKAPRQDLIWDQLRSILSSPTEQVQSEGPGVKSRPPLWEGCGPQGIGRERT